MYVWSSKFPIQTCDATFIDLCFGFFDCWFNWTSIIALCSMFCWSHQGKKYFNLFNFDFPRNFSTHRVIFGIERVFHFSDQIRNNIGFLLRSSGRQQTIPIYFLHWNFEKLFCDIFSWVQRVKKSSIQLFESKSV